MPSRRLAVAGLLGMIADQSVCIAAAAVPKKVTKPMAHYQTTPNGIQACSTCSLFVAPKQCRVVIGEVSADGWCSLYDMVD